MKNPKIAIIGGCGHVGLPLGLAFAYRANAQVSLVDINRKAVDTVNSGKLPFVEKGGEQILQTVIGKTLIATLQPDAVTKADAVILVTGTPVDEHLNPRVKDVLQVIEAYSPHFKEGQLIILRSTLAPGVTELIWKYLARQKVKVDLAFCPERVAQGLAIEEIFNFPQMVSAFDSKSEQRAAELFSLVAPKILRLTPQEAELAKLFSNSWRYIEFATANQHYMMAESCGVDFNRVYTAMTQDYPRAKSFSRPGLAAGPCLFKDTMQLNSFYNNQFFLGHAAMLVNEGLPNFIIRQLEDKLGSLENKRIGILGMGFKANHDDTRESLSYKVKKILETKMAIALETDAYQPSHSCLKDILIEADALILGVPHSEYSQLDLCGKPFVDCWGLWKKSPDLEVSPLPKNPELKAA